MPDGEQVLEFRIAQESRRVLAGREFQDDHSFRPPIALHWRGFGALNDVPSAMLSDEGRHVVGVLPERMEIVDPEIEYEICLHCRIPVMFVRSPEHSAAKVASNERGRTTSRCALLLNYSGCYSATISPLPPNSAGKSFSLGSPSRIGSTVSA